MNLLMTSMYNFRGQSTLLGATCGRWLLVHQHHGRSREIRRRPRWYVPCTRRPTIFQLRCAYVPDVPKSRNRHRRPTHQQPSDSEPESPSPPARPCLSRPAMTSQPEPESTPCLSRPPAVAVSAALRLAPQARRHNHHRRPHRTLLVTRISIARFGNRAKSIGLDLFRILRSVGAFS